MMMMINTMMLMMVVVVMMVMVVVVMMMMVMVMMMMMTMMICIIMKINMLMIVMINMMMMLMMMKIIEMSPWNLGCLFFYSTVTMTIGKLRGLLSRLLKVASSTQKLSYYDNKVCARLSLIHLPIVKR